MTFLRPFLCPSLLPVLVALLVLAGASPALAADARFAEAEALARKDEPAAATDLYRALLAEGKDGAALRYNLGTLALEEGRVGDAVLHLLAARRLAPGDDDVRHNLEVALEARADRLGGEPVVSFVPALGASVSPAAARWGLAVPLALLGVALALLGVFDPSSRPRARKITVAVAATLAVVALAGGVVRAARASVESTRVAVVVVDSTPALKDPEAGAPEAFVAHAGLYGDVVDETGGFLRVRFENGLEAWLAEADVRLVDASS